MAKEREKALKRADKVRDQGHTRAGMGKYEEAEELYQKSMVLRVDLLGADDPEVAALYTDMADMWMSQHEFGKAEPYYDSAKRIVETCIAQGRAAEDIQRQHRRALRDLAFLYYLQGSVERRHSEAQTGKWNKAEEFFKRAIEMTESQLGRRTPELVEPLRNLASLYVKMGNFQRGELNFAALELPHLLRRCIGIQLHNYGTDSPCVLQTRQQLAIVHERRDQRARHDAATVVQAGWRGHKGRQRTHQVKSRRQAAADQQTTTAANIDLPDDQLLHALSFEPSATLCLCRAVCRRWREVLLSKSAHSFVWGEVLLHEYPSLPDVADSVSHAGPEHAHSHAHKLWRLSRAATLAVQFGKSKWSWLSGQYTLSTVSGLSGQPMWLGPPDSGSIEEGDRLCLYKEHTRVDHNPYDCWIFSDYSNYCDLNRVSGFVRSENSPGDRLPTDVVRWNTIKEEHPTDDDDGSDSSRNEYRWRHDPAVAVSACADYIRSQMAARRHHDGS